MALRKAFPQDRQYDYWNILMYFLVYKDASVPETDRNLSGTLAYRLIRKAAESIATDTVSLARSRRALNDGYRNSRSVLEKPFRPRKNSTCSSTSTSSPAMLQTLLTCFKVRA